MTDEQWKLKVTKIESADTLLKEMVKLRENCEIGDPYYQDLWDTILNRAQQLAVDSKTDS